MTKNVLNKLGFLGAVFAAAVGFPLIFASTASAQLPAPAVPANPAAPAPQAEVERVIVTGSNIQRRKRPARTRWTPIGRKTSRSWVSVTQPT